MNTPMQPSPSPIADLLRSFLPIGTLRKGAWAPTGAGVLVLDTPVVWLVTATAAIDALGDEPVHTWVPQQRGAAVFDLAAAQQRFGLRWIRHATQEIAATLLPLDPSFAIKAFGLQQSAWLRDVAALQPTVSLGCPYSQEMANPGHPAPAVFTGVVARVEPEAHRIYTTAPLLPRNAGAPLLLASPYGGPITLAGILTGTIQLGGTDPRDLPIRLAAAVPFDTVLELIQSPAANACREAATAGTRQEP